MADFSNLKDEIKAKIQSNGKQEITGDVLQQTMLNMVDETDREISELSKKLESISIPDWDAAEDEAGYIKNRTHYKEAVERAFIGIEKGDYILDAEGNPEGWESWVEAGGIEDESAKVSLPVTIAFSLSFLNFELTFDHVGQREILEYEEYDDSYASILEVGIDEKEGGCYLHFTTRGCGTPWLNEGEEIDVRIESFKRLNDGYIPSTIVRKSDLEGLSAEIDSQNQLIEDLQNTKIDKEADDYYPQLSVGLADNLAGVDVVDSEISFRRSGGGAISDGTARIESVKGNSVVWNQIVNAALRNDLINYGNPQIETTDSGIIYTFTEEGNFKYGDASRVSFGLGNNIVANHKYAVLIDVKTPSTGIQMFVGETVWDRLPVTPNALSRIGRIQTITEVNDNYKTQGVIYPIASGASVVSGDVLEVYNPIVYDLTKMFGAGNEPTTIEELYARIPMGVDLNAYNEGEVIHMDVQSLESVGVNQWDEEWESGTIVGSDGALVDDSTKIRTKNLIRVLPNKEYHFTQPSQLPIRVFLYGADKAYKAYKYITSSSFLIPSDAHYIKVVFEYPTYNNDICINLSDASVNGKYFPYVKRTEDLSIIRKYFPNGMKSAGTAHDEIRYNKATQKWEKVQRIGSVDMGSLNWSQPIDVGSFFTYSIKDYKKPTNNAERSDGLLCQHYAGSTNPFAASIDDKAWLRFESENTIVFRDSTYTDAASFKAAMQGVILYYELAEPFVTELDQSDQFKDLDYQVWNAGTEKAIAEGKSAPLAADITYGFNAIGKIKELESLVAALRAKVGI